MLLQNSGETGHSLLEEIFKLNSQGKCKDLIAVLET